MISFFHFSHIDKEEDILLEIKSQLPGQYVTLQNIYEKQNKNQDFYMICRFVREVSLNEDPKFGKALEVLFGETEHTLSIFLKNNLSEKMEKVMSEGKLLSGDFVILQRPTVAVLHENCHVRSVHIQLGDDESQNVFIWKSTSLYYIEPFLMKSTLKNYRHLLFYEIDDTGSKERLLSNLCNLATAQGPIKLLSHIADTDANYVALARFIGQTSPLPSDGLTTRKRKCNPSVQIKFDEILFESKPYGFSTFTAFFFDELATEIEKAVIAENIKHGDLVVLRYPRFKRKTAAPINMHFPPQEKINMIVLKNQYQPKKIGCKLSLSDINLNFLNKKQEIEDNIVDYSPLQFSSIKTCFDGDSALLKLCSKLKKYGDISTISKMTSNNSQPLKKGIVLSYFLKFISSINTDKQDKVTLFIREIYFDCKYGEYLKLILHGKFAKSFSLALKNKNIVPGDIVCIINPVVWQNHMYIPSNYETDVDHVIVVAIPEKQKIVIFKLREIGETKGFKRLYKENCTVKNVRSPDKANTIPHKTVPDITVPNNKIPEKSIPYQLVNPKLIQDECFFKGNRTDDELKEGFPIQYKMEFSFLPVCMTKPALNPSLDLVSGYCVFCEQMFPYSSTIGIPNDNSKRMCPICFKGVKLDFCLEMVGIGLDKEVIVLLHSTNAEKYLNITCTQFLAYNDICRELVINLLKEKLKHNKSTGNGNTIKITDCLNWEWCT